MAGQLVAPKRLWPHAQLRLHQRSSNTVDELVLPGQTPQSRRNKR